MGVGDAVVGVKGPVDRLAGEFPLGRSDRIEIVVSKRLGRSVMRIARVTLSWNVEVAE
jgi:hypothetical protein